MFEVLGNKRLVEALRTLALTGTQRLAFIRESMKEGIPAVMDDAVMHKARALGLVEYRLHTKSEKGAILAQVDGEVFVTELSDKGLEALRLAPAN